VHYQVPQYLNVEDKIIGPLTLKQFIYLLVGGGIVFLLFGVLKFSVFIIVAVPIAFLFLVLAFYKIDNQKSSKFILNFLGFVSRPSIYTWKKSSPKEPAEKKESPPVVKKVEPVKQAPKESGLKDLLWKVEIRKNKK
jgi:hypothetical protein